MSGITFTGLGDLIANVESLGRRMHTNAAAVGKATAPDIEAYAKTIARWTDRSGNARQGLTGLSEATADAIIVYLYTAMFYGEFLEDASGHNPNEGHFRTIIPAMTAFYGEIMARLDSIMRGG